MNWFCKFFGHRWAHYGMTSRCSICKEFYDSNVEICPICGGKLSLIDKGSKGTWLCCENGCLTSKNCKMSIKEYNEKRKEEFESNGMFWNFIRNKKFTLSGNQEGRKE